MNPKRSGNTEAGAIWFGDVFAKLKRNIVGQCGRCNMDDAEYVTTYVSVSRLFENKDWFHSSRLFLCLGCKFYFPVLFRGDERRSTKIPGEIQRNRPWNSYNKVSKASVPHRSNFSFVSRRKILGVHVTSANYLITHV